MRLLRKLCRGAVRTVVLYCLLWRRVAKHWRAAQDRRTERYRADATFRSAHRAYQRAYYQCNRPRLLAARRARAAANREAERANKRRRYAANPRARLDYWKRWRAANLARARAYQRACDERRRAVSGSFSADEWLALVAHYDSRCGYCGIRTDRLEADHRTPISRGGLGTIDNVIPACVRCNRRKHDRTEAEFRALLADQVVRIREERFEYVVYVGARSNHTATTIWSDAINGRHDTTRLLHEERTRRDIPWHHTGFVIGI